MRHPCLLLVWALMLRCSIPRRVWRQILLAVLRHQSRMII
ncbi:hypothetical protein EVA_20059 [gut metagenome]|uniref:Uncharacterized protein n=1 Tax=gut metagenome TaxID=749906 RepID=J9FWU2_9ZZZZ